MDTLLTNNNEEIIKLESTSYNTADADPIVLNETNTIRTSFLPTLVDNNKNPECCVNGKLVHERKSKNNNSFSEQKFSKRDVKIGDILEISLSTTETKNLFDGLKSLYDLHKDIGYVPNGTNKFSRIDTGLLDTIRKCGNINDNFSIEDICRSIEYLTESLNNKDNVTEEFKQFSKSSEISNFTNIVNISKLKLCLDFFEENENNDNEEDWQNFLNDNQWLITQLFAYPTTIYDSKAYVGGKRINNDGGKIVDYLYRNDLTGNIALIEIKTPLTSLLGKEYRTNIFSPSNDLSGAINQVLRYKDNLIKDWNSIQTKNVISFNPECLLIIGSITELNSEDKLASFELFRGNSIGVKIISFDELKNKIINLVNCLNNN